MNDRRKSDRRVPPAVAQHAIEERAELLARIEEQAREIERIESERAEQWRIRRDAVADIDTKSAIIAELLAKIEEQRREVGLITIERNRLINNPNNVFKKMCDMALKQRDDLAAELAALKLQPIGVVLPEPFEMRSFQTVDRGCTNYKAGFNAALRKMRERLSSPPVSAGIPFGGYDPKFCPGSNPENPQDPVSAGVADERVLEAAYSDCLKQGHQALTFMHRNDLFANFKARAALTARPDHSAQSRADGLMISVEDVEYLKHARRELTRLDRAPLYIRQALAQKITNMLAAAHTPGKEIE